MAGPKMKPVLIAQLSRAIPKAWLLSSEVSEATALSVLLTAMGNKQSSISHGTPL